MINELILAGVSFFHPQPQDSLGIETVNGKIFVIHKVDEKETLYAISRRYGTTVEAILQHNPAAGKSLEIGQILKVPYTAKTTSRISAAPKGGIVHKVEAKETMFSISKQYGVTVDEIRQWNNLSDNALSIGQELVIKKQKPSTATDTRPVAQEIINRTGTHTVAAKETMYSIARQYSVSVQQLREWNKLENDELKIGQVVYVAPPEQKNDVARPKLETPRTETPVVAAEERNEPKETKKEPQQVPVEASRPKTETPAPAQTIRISESVKNSDEVMEAGLAELIEGTEGNRKYLALHRSAPVGTILKVRNEMNNREVFVRVMGKLPETAMTDKLVIKVSKSAYDRLGAIDPRFRVEVTYYK
jgi:LysM repeat protein